eukprot:gene1610-12735_t
MSMNDQIYFSTDLREPLDTKKEKWMSIFQTIAGLFCIGFISVVVAISIFSGVFGIFSVQNYITAQKFNDERCSSPKMTSSDSIVYKQKIPILINDVTIYNGLITQQFFKKRQSIYFEKGVIKCIGDTPLRDCKLSPNTKVYNLKNAVVTPGLVDLHSHFGVYSYPGDLKAYQDGNEMGADPTTPYARVIDALRASDQAIKEILAGGVTSSVILPGSGNVMGGEGLAVKLRGNTVEEMRIKNAPRYLKFACGENPKRVYGSQTKMPTTRMGNAWVMRKKFEAAKKLLKEQNEWDCSKGEKPTNLELEPLVALLKGEAILHNHCYEVVDFEMAIRVAKEFGYKITTFHHAVEAHKIPQVFKENNISIAAFADHWGFKMEAYDSNVNAPKILYENGVSVILKSDHPVLHARTLITEAAKAYHYGLEQKAALAAVTSEPAKAAGLFHRIGSLEIGKEADVLVWNDHFFKNGAKPTHVFIEGVLEHQKELQLFGNDVMERNKGKLEVKEGSNTIYAIKNVKILTGEQEIQSGTIIVTNDVITCIGSTCQPPPSATTYSVSGSTGFITPGLIESASTLGLVEIGAESATQDGISPGDVVLSVQAMDGIVGTGKMMSAAYKAGVTISITKPQGSKLINGQSVAFWTTDGNKFVEDLLVKNPTAIHFNIGNSAKGSGPSSISGQIDKLRTLLKSNDATIQKIKDKELLVACTIQRADHILSLLRLKEEFGFNLVIVGAAEAHLVSKQLSKAKVSVILTPQHGDSNWEQRRSNQFYHIEKLIKDKVQIGLAIGQHNELRDLRFLAGNIQRGVKDLIEISDSELTKMLN